MESIVNILPLSYRHDVETMRQRVMTGISQLANERTWHGRRVAFKMKFSGDMLTFCGGRKHIPRTDIRFVTVNMDYEHRHNIKMIQQWGAQFSQLVLVVDAQELLESSEFRYAVTAHRLALKDRYHDVLLMLMDVDRIMSIEDTGDYASTYIGVNAAFGPRAYNGSQLYEVYRDHWNDLYSLALAQDLLPFTRRYSKRKLSLPLLLICHSEKPWQMGFQELLISCINHAVRPLPCQLSNLSTLKSYSTMPGFNDIKFNNEFLNNLVKKIRGRDESIRLAVIGLTACGKTYLLADAVVAIKDLGCKAQNAPNLTLKPTATAFINDVEMARTPIYACRPSNQYATSFTYEYKSYGKKFLLEFVDVPGEVVTKDSILCFFSILSALSQHTKKIFLEKTWKNGNRQWKTVELIGSEKSGSPRMPTVSDKANQETDGIDLGGDEDQQQSMSDKRYSQSFIVDGSRTQAYETDNESVFQGLIYQQFTIIKEEEISGQTLLEHFEEYLTDTAINAIIDAWNLLGIQTRHSIGLNQFKNEYKDHFYFHYYTYFATDIVVCDRCAVGSDDALIDKSDNEERFSGMIGALAELLEYEQLPKKNLYLAFKGVDTFIEGMPFHKLSTLKMGVLPANTLYSLFVLHLLASIDASNQGEEINEYDDVTPTSVSPFTTDIDFWHMIYSKGPFMDNDKWMSLSKKLFEEYQNGQHRKYIKSSGFTMTSGDGLRSHLFFRIEQFLRLPLAVNVPDDPRSIGRKVLFGQLPPHVYFTATPIDKEFNISENDPTSHKFKGGITANDPYRRLCFGTHNLVVDILKAHNINISDPAGSLLNYCYSLEK